MIDVTRKGKPPTQLLQSPLTKINQNTINLLPQLLMTCKIHPDKNSRNKHISVTQQKAVNPQRQQTKATIITLEVTIISVS